MRFQNTKLIILLISLCTIKTNAQFSISPRLGAEIDKSEKEYFGLFPSIKNFTSAKTKVLADKKVEIIISRKDKETVTDTTFNISSQLANNLASYIEGFEQCRNKERTVNWLALEGLAERVIALDYVSPEIEEKNFILKNGKLIKGKIIYLSDSLIVIWKGDDKYNWLNLSKSAEQLKVSEINFVKVESNGSLWQGAQYGALAFGVPALVFLNNSKITNSIIFATFGAVIGGIVGAVIDIASNNKIGAKTINYIDFNTYIKDYLGIFKYPPPELDKFANQ